MLSFVWDILGYLKRDDRRAWLVLLLASLAGGMSRSLFLATVNSASVAIEAGRFSTFYLYVPVLLVLISLGATMFGTIRGRMVAERLAFRMRSKLAHDIGQTNLHFIEREKHHVLRYHLLNTVDTVTESYFMFLGFVSAAVTLTFNALYIAWLSPIGLLIVVIVAAAGVTTDWSFERANLSQRLRLDELHRRSHGAYSDLLDGFKELRLSDAKTNDMHRCIDELNRQIYESSVRVAQVSATGTAATDLFQYLAIGILGVGFSLFASISPVTIIQLIAAVLFTMGPLTSIVGIFPSFGRARVALENLRRLTKSIERVREPARGAPSSRLPPFESIALKDVVFHFGAVVGGSPQVEQFALGPIDLIIERGDVVFVVGGNGSGKTVLMRVVTGLYPLTAGELLFNGKFVAREDMKDYRDHFTTVFNDFFLFKGLLGHRDVAPEVVTKWLKYFGIASKTTLVDGRFSTIELSTGQRKRLALIVALLDERPILMLDEFGAEQDPEHRDQFYRVWLPELRKTGMTILIVSHDDAYFECADVLVRMDYGKIVECRRLKHRGGGQGT